MATSSMWDKDYTLQTREVGNEKNQRKSILKKMFLLPRNSTVKNIVILILGS